MPKIAKIVQGSYISLETLEIIKKEAKKLGIKHPCRLTSDILTKWAKEAELKAAREMIGEADGKEKI